MLHTVAVLVSVVPHVEGPEETEGLVVRRFVKRTLPPRRVLMRETPPRQVARPLARRAGVRQAPAVAVAPAPLSTARQGLQGMPIPMVKGLAPPPDVPLQLRASLRTPQIGPQARPGALAGSRSGADEVDLGLEMLGVEALDTGRHRALVVVDPRDPKKLAGFLYLSSIYTELMERAERESGTGRRGNLLQSTEGQRRRAERETLQGLAEKMSQQTGVRTQVLDALSLDDPRLAEVPFVLLTALCDFSFSEAEEANLGRYLIGGGFLYAEVVVLPLRAPMLGHGSEAYDLPALRAFLRSALRSVGLREGMDWQFRRMPPEHPLFRCYHDLRSLPRGFFDVPYWYANNGATETLTPAYLEEIRVHDRTVGVYSRKDYADFWAGQAEVIRERDRAATFAGTFDIGGEELPAYDLGVNILVYALTREGSLAQRLVAPE
ncbi:MAG: DUF4159 domain-containing protein [Candidatus Latescibacterota bacterium]